MRTIAITIDEPTLGRVDEVLGRSPCPARNRSALVREALHDYLRQLDARAADEAERRVWRRHRSRLDREAAALVEEQAVP
jgi:metal-responsive CopG/Arc/MetJ family transcriptional regulator